MSNPIKPTGIYTHNHGPIDVSQAGDARDKIRAAVDSFKKEQRRAKFQPVVIGDTTVVKGKKK